MSLIRQHVSCQDFVEEVTAYWEGALGTPERDRFEEHYLICPPCRSYSAQMQQTASLLAGLGRARDTAARVHGAPPDTREALREPGGGHRDSGRYTRAFKFFRTGAVAPFSGVAWPAAPDGEAGPWVWSGDDTALCVEGVHACRQPDLPYWLNDELWIVELDGLVDVGGRKIVARRGRLIAHVARWDEETRRQFVESCLASLRTTMIELLAEHRRDPPSASADLGGPSATAEVDRLLRSGTLGETERAVCGYFQDAVVYQDLAPSVAFITALGCEVAQGPGARDKERQRQAGWLVDHLRLA